MQTNEKLIDFGPMREAWGSLREGEQNAQSVLRFGNSAFGLITGLFELAALLGMCWGPPLLRRDYGIYLLFVCWGTALLLFWLTLWGSESGYSDVIMFLWALGLTVCLVFDTRHILKRPPDRVASFDVGEPASYMYPLWARVPCRLGYKPQMVGTVLEPGLLLLAGLLIMLGDLGGWRRFFSGGGDFPATLVPFTACIGTCYVSANSWMQQLIEDRRMLDEQITQGDKSDRLQKKTSSSDQREAEGHIEAPDLISDRV